jgi:hypothetical protein
MISYLNDLSLQQDMVSSSEVLVSCICKPVQ